MKKRLILLLVLLALAALAAGIATLYYAITARQFAKRQAAFRARGSAALQRVAGLLPRQPAAAPTYPASPPPGPTTSRAAASPTSATGAVSPRPRRIPASPAAPRRGLEQLAGDLYEHAPDLARLPSMDTVWLTLDLVESDLDARGSLTDAGLRKVRDTCRHRLASLENSMRLDKNRKNDRLELLERTLPNGPVPAALARMEDGLLAADWTLPDYNNYLDAVYGGINTYAMHTLAKLAILRTALRGDGARAGLLLLKQLEYLHGRYLIAYPTGDNLLGFDLPQTLFTLGELSAISGETLERAARLLASMQPTAGQVADLRQAHALRLVNYLTDDRYGWSDPSPFVGFKQNSLHFLQINGVGIDTLLYRLNRPKITLYLQDYAAAWADGRRDDMKAAVRQLASLARVCNQDPETLRDALYRIDDAGLYYHQNALDQVRLILAAERYRRDTGQFPASNSDLGPRYLDPPLDVTSATWHLARLDAFEARLASGDTVTLSTRPVLYIARLWRRIESGEDHRDRPPDWDLSKEERDLIQVGFKERRVLRLDVVIPCFPGAWRDELDLIKRIGEPAVPAAPPVNTNSAKNLSNQTTATALKK